jgi:hypothetical protein
MQPSRSLRANRYFIKDNLTTLVYIPLLHFNFRRLSRHTMARTKPGIKKKFHQPVEPQSAVVRELHLACKAEDSKRVAELLNDSSITAADATGCLEETWRNLQVTRLLLEHGADPAVCARTNRMSESFDLIKLLVEFGYDIKINGHCVLQ